MPRDPAQCRLHLDRPSRRILDASQDLAVAARVRIAREVWASLELTLE
jgi:hypothetical protein